MKNKIKNKIKNNGMLKILYYFLKNIQNGYKVHKRLLSKYGKDCVIYVGQHPGTGDVYIQSMYLNTIDNKDYVFTVIGHNARKVAEWWGIKNVEQLSLEESNDLLRYAKFVSLKKDVKIDVLHYHPGISYYDDYVGFLRNYRGLNFFKMMDVAVFGESYNVVDVCPQKNVREQYIQSIYKKYHLKPGRTILLAPYANSLMGIPVEFWTNLVKKLNSMGYSVCTNSFSTSEPVIEGSCGISIQYPDLIAFLEYGGAVISLRSGFVDCISSANCKKIVLYPKQIIYDIMGGLGSSMDYFSLNKMELCNDAIEYEIDFEEEKSLEKVSVKILSNFIKE